METGKTKTDVDEQLQEVPMKNGLVYEYFERQGTLNLTAVHKARQQFFDTNLDRLAEAFEDHTVGAMTRKLSLAEVGALVAAWGDASEIARNRTLTQLARDVDEIIDGSAVFVKLGSRSPKDVTWLHERTMDRYRELVHESPENEDRNQHLMWLYRGQIDCLRVNSFREAMELLGQSSRVLFDLQLDLLCPNDLRSTMIVRPWLEIPLAAEWRGFMYGRQLRALSQYFTHLYFPSLAASVDTVAKRITQFFADVVEPRLPVDLHNAVIDFIVLPDRVLLLEVNQYAHSTGPGLFDWVEDESILRDGSDPIEVRVRSEPPPLEEIRGGLPAQWLQILEEL